MTNIPYVFTSEELRLIKENYNFIDFKLWDSKVFKSLKNEIRKYLIDLNEKKCFYCKTELDEGTVLIPIEHIIDKSSYPKYTFEPSNLTIACPYCNTCKGRKNVVNKFIHPHSIFYPTTTDYVSIVHAYFDSYDQHIRIEDSIFFVGLTDKGKKTIEVCKLYRCRLAEEKSKKFRASMLKNEQHPLVSTLVTTKDQALRESIQLQIVQILERHKLAEELEKIFLKVKEESSLTNVVERVYSKPEIKDLVEQTTLDDLEIIHGLISKSSELELVKKIINNKKIKTLIKEMLEEHSPSQLDFIVKIKEVLNDRINLEYIEIVEEINLLFEGTIPISVCKLIEEIVDTGVANRGKSILNLVFKVNRNTSIKNNLLSLSDSLVEGLQNELRSIKGLNFSDAQINYINLLQKMIILRSIFQYRDYEYLNKFKSSLLSIVS